MLSYLAKLEVKVNDKSYQLICDTDSPLDNVKVALNAFLQHVQKIEDEVKAAQAQIKVETAPEEKKE